MKKFESYKYWVNEKFTEDSDPIHDMGIGMDELIKRFIEEETANIYNKKDLLWICAKYGKTEFVKYLLEKGYNVHANDDCALRWASDNGHTEVVKVLLNAGANVHTIDDYALRWASENGHIETVKVLKDWIAKEKKNRVKESLNEKFTEDEESNPIHDMGIGDPLGIAGSYLQKYAEEKGYDFQYNKRGTPSIGIPVFYYEFVGYWPLLITEIRYTITYVSEWDNKFSLRKQWFGYDSKKTKNSIIKLMHIGSKDRSLDEFKKILNKDKNYPFTFIKQNLMGRFNHPREIIPRMHLNIQKEKLKKGK